MPTRKSGRPAAAQLSIVVPAFNESKNLHALHQRLCRVLDASGTTWELIVVDDHSDDDTFQIVRELAQIDARVRGVRLAHNFGSHTAIACGLRHAGGRSTVVMAADLQDPPETLPELLAKWEAGAQVVWAVRAAREGERLSTLGFARLYYWMMRHVVGIRQMPPSGADFVLLDRRVVNALRRFDESNVSILALITWMGYRQAHVAYAKQPRVHGRSGWSLASKVKLVIDSVTSFSSLPIRAMSLAGLLMAVGGFAYAAVVIVNVLTGHPVEGWSSLMVAILVIGGTQILLMGVLGEYLWRTLDESRRRPRFLIESTAHAGLPAQSFLDNGGAMPVFLTHR